MMHTTTRIIKKKQQLMLARVIVLRCIGSPGLRRTHNSSSDNSIQKAQQQKAQRQQQQLPDVIEQQCQKWERILQAEWEAKMAINSWLSSPLKCNHVISSVNTTKMILSTENLKPSARAYLQKQCHIGQTLELKPISLLQPKRPRWQQQQQCPVVDNNNIGGGGGVGGDKMVGTINRWAEDGLYVVVKRTFNSRERQWLQDCCSFDVRKSPEPLGLLNSLDFLAKRRTDWCKFPCYTTLLQAFKCLPMPADTGEDPTEWIGSHGKDLDPSQCAALGAALNLKRPIVAVHGPPGSGKTHLLAEYLHILSQQGKRVLVLSTSGLIYQAMGTFCRRFPGDVGNFLLLKAFLAHHAARVIGDPALERLIEARTYGKLDEEQMDARARQLYEQSRKLRASIEQRKQRQQQQQQQQASSRRDNNSNDRLFEHTERKCQQMVEEAHRLNGEASRAQLAGVPILFALPSWSMLSMFRRMDLTFDVVIFHNAGAHSEFHVWWMALPTAPILRLFGSSYRGGGITVGSAIGRELGYNKTLLQRLDDQFGASSSPEEAAEVCFPLHRQYTKVAPRKPSRK